MAEQEPKVRPIIRLPQILAARSAPDGKPSGLSLSFSMNVSEAAEGEEEAEELVEGEGEPPPSIKSQISGEQTKLSGDTASLRAGISSILRRALLNFAEQERQRAWLVTVLLTVQAAVLLAILPGYLFGHFQFAGVLVSLGGLALFGIAWLLNWMGRTGEASFLLVLGGEALVVLNVLLSAAQHVSLVTLHTSLLFLLVILSGGILFTPETAIILASVSAVFTTLVLLLFPPAAALAAVFTAQGRYLSLAFLILAQLAVGVVAWLFGRQMQESVHIVTYVSGLQMSNKRLLKRLHETDEKKRHLEAGIAVIQQTHARVAAGDYSARAHVEGELLPLAVSLNLMLERVESFVHGDHERERMETAVAVLAELAGRVGQESQGRMPVPTGTALDGLSIAIKQMQSNVNQRLAKVQQSALALMATVDRCQDSLLPVAEVLQEHLRSVDALVIAADNVMTSARRQLEFTTQAEQLLLAAAPAGVELKVVEETPQPVKGTSALRLAEELEHRAALAGAAVPAALMPTDPLLAEPVPVPISVLEELLSAPGTTLPDVSAPALDTQVVAEAMPSQEAEIPMVAALTGEAATVTKEAEQPEAVPAAEAPTTEAPAADVVATPEADVPDPVKAEVSAPAEKDAAQEQPTLEQASVQEGIEAIKITLADVDREVAEEEAAAQATTWNLEQLRELVQMLTTMAGEATQQERNARTLAFKLRSMLQGMPNTRRVDMVSAWLGAALEAVSQSANQVQQASKPIPASAFPASRKEQERV